MIEDLPPERVTIGWSPEALADLRAIERGAAMQILYCIDRYLTARSGDVNEIEATGVRHRREGYR